MSLTRDLGKRIELLSMDAHFCDITIALYRQDHADRPEYLVHSYSQLEGTRQRLVFIRHAMKVLGQLEEAGDWLYFTCASAHQAAARRTFLEACKLSPTAIPEPRPLSVLDKKSGRRITALSLGRGGYQIAADGPEDGKSARVESVLGGLVKLAEVAPVAGSPGQLVFPCEHSHDALVGLLLPRALNVRAVLREEEAAVGRGMLVAPSQQK
jgi:hypothetical protein